MNSRQRKEGQQQCRVAVEETAALAAWCRSVTAPERSAEAEGPDTREAGEFEKARRVVRRLGAHIREDELVELGFWVPEAVRAENPAERFWLEIFTPEEPIDFRLPHQELSFRQDVLEPTVTGEFAWAVVAGMRAGTRGHSGAYYQLRCRFSDGSTKTIPDYLAVSVPFGAFGPAELYDTSSLFTDRPDREHYRREVETAANAAAAPDTEAPRFQGPTNILQIHVAYATREGTLEALTSRYRELARKIRAGEALESWEENYLHFDAVQLMPIEPVIEYETGPGFWRPRDAHGMAATGQSAGDSVRVELIRPDMSNWGYDILTSASPAVNPVLLGSSRPDELVEFIAELHSFPGKPIKVIFDVVFGHGDNQAVELIASELFAAQGMYGQVLDYRHPVVRALLLEMQRRKVNFGADGVRVDGAQDFKYWDPELRQVFYDDDYLALMNDLVQELDGVRYRPWMVFEDGRPWPQEDWELSSSYREVTRKLPNVYQWGPITFAHNTPFLFTFWISKWWRIKEITRFGGRWITGSANHDTLRRGTQVDPEERVNTYLGESLPAILRKAYDNPTALLFSYVATPGVPMEFLNAIMRAPWSFIRNSDDRYAVKVASEESRFLYWAVDKESFAEADVFRRLKSLGFGELSELRRFMDTLADAVKTTRDNLPIVAAMMNSIDPPFPGRPYDVAALKRVARFWMDDVHEFCNVTRYTHALDPEQVAFSREVREFRRKRPWLGEAFTEHDRLEVIEPTEGSVIFYGLRSAPDGSETLFFVLNMEGAPRSLVPGELLRELLAGHPSGHGADGAGSDSGRLPRKDRMTVPGTPLFATPGMTVPQELHPGRPIVLGDSEGLVFRLEA